MKFEKKENSIQIIMCLKKIFCYEIRYQKHKYWDIPSYFSSLSQAYYPFITPWKMTPAQPILCLPFPNINNTSSSSSVLQIIPFNNETQVAFGLMLEVSRNFSREHLSLSECQQMIDWITDTGVQKSLIDREAKRKSWTKTNFHYQDWKLWQNSDKHHSKSWEVLMEPKIFNIIDIIHNFIGYAGQSVTGKNVNKIY